MSTEYACEIIKSIYNEIESNNFIDKDAFTSVINYLNLEEVNIYYGTDRFMYI